jgi:hypothetical protein
MFEDFLHLQPGHLRGLKAHVSKNQQKCPEQIMTWAAKQVAINKVNKQNAQAQGISVKEYLQKCGVDESTSSFTSSITRNPTFGPVPFRFVRGDVAQFHEDLFGRSETAPQFAGIHHSAKFEATHMFLDLPEDFSPDFTVHTRPH